MFCFEKTLLTVWHTGADKFQTVPSCWHQCWINQSLKSANIWRSYSWTVQNCYHKIVIITESDIILSKYIFIFSWTILILLPPFKNASLFCWCVTCFQKSHDVVKSNFNATLIYHMFSKLHVITRSKFHSNIFVQMFSHATDSWFNSCLL